MTYGVRKQRFIDYLNNNMFSHAFLFEVSNYDEDYKFIISFVKMLFCDMNNSFSDVDCDKCNICNLISEEKFLDLYVIRPDGNEIKKEQLLKLETEFSNTSTVSKNKVYIILEAEKMNKYSSNSILKFLEEPRDNIYGILVTKNKYKLLSTIISRCLYFNIRDNVKFDFDDDYYKEFITYLVNCDDLFINYDSIIEYFIDSNDSDDKSKKQFNKNKIFSFFNNINLYLLDYYNGNIGDKDLDNIDKNRIVNYINIIQNNLLDLEFNLNYKLWFDNLFSSLNGGNYD